MYVVTPHLNRLNKAVQMRGHNIIMKIIMTLFSEDNAVGQVQSSLRPSL